MPVVSTPTRTARCGTDRTELMAGGSMVELVMLIQAATVEAVVFAAFGRAVACAVAGQCFQYASANIRALTSQVHSPARFSAPRDRRVTSPGVVASLRIASANPCALAAGPFGATLMPHSSVTI